MKAIKMFAISIVIVMRPLLALAVTILGVLGLTLTANAADVLISSQAAPQTGTFYRMQGPGPLPYNRFPSLPLWAVVGSTNIFLIDDRSVDYDSLYSKLQSEAEESEGDPVPPPYDFPTNVLWIEILGVTNNLAYLTLHNTRSNYYYELLSRENVSSPAWTPGQIVRDVYATNQVYFDPVPAFPEATKFFRGVEGQTVVSVSGNSDAVEPHTGITSGHTGSFLLRRLDPVVSDLTVAYRVSGSASNGVDYSTLGGTATIPANNHNGTISVAPYEDNLVEFDETVKLSLILTNGYLVDTNSAVATIIIEDIVTNVLFETVATLSKPVGIDYHEPSKSLIVSVNYAQFGGGETNNFARIYTNVVSGNVVTVITNWSGVRGVSDEVKLATVFTGGAATNAAGFTNGDIFFSSTNGIGWGSADGTVSNLNWCVLTNSIETNSLPLRGSLYVDRTGVFSNQLIAVTSPGSGVPGNKGVWRIDAQGHPTMLTNIETLHLEGVITLTNEVQRWGPWAGLIITGDEDALENGSARPLIFTIDTNGLVATWLTSDLFPTGIYPEDFDIIPPNEDLYCVNYHESGTSSILKLSKTWLTNYVGDLVVTDSGEATFSGKLFFVHWDQPSGEFVVRRIRLPLISDNRFEHVTFAPINLPKL